MSEGGDLDFEGVEAVVRRHSTETPGGYAAIELARSDGSIASASFLQGERLHAARRSPIASITKPVTATAVMQLVASGDVALDEPISTYVSEFDPQPPSGMATAQPVTVRQILTHTSGLGDLPDDELRQLPATPAAMLAAIGRRRPRFSPGSAFAYASDPWFLLSAVIERTSGLAYREFLRVRIFEPLGMAATSFDPRDPGPKALPPEGTFPLDDLSSDQLVDLMAGLAMPGGGLWSTPGDVATFGRAMLLGGAIGHVRILDRTSIEAMTRLETAAVRGFEAGEAVHYGLGVGRPGLSGRSPASASAFGHTGATGSVLLVDPESDLVLVYLRNWWGVSMAATDEVIAAVYGARRGGAS